MGVTALGLVQVLEKFYKYFAQNARVYYRRKADCSKLILTEVRQVIGRMENNSTALEILSQLQRELIHAC